MGLQFSGNFGQLTDLDPVLSELFFQSYEQVQPLLIPSIYAQRGSTKSKETDFRIGSFSEPKEWNGQINYQAVDPGYEVQYKHTHLTNGFKITQEMFEDMQYDGVFDRAENLGQSFIRKQVRDEASTFENAFSTAAANAGYDGKPLVATDHPRSKADQSTTVSNYLGAKTLSEDNLEAARTQLEELGDDKGQETNAMASILLVGRQLRRKAAELVESEMTPESANNAINVNTDLSYIVHPMISGKKWFVIDGMMARRVLKWYTRIPVSFGASQDESNTLMRSYYGRTRYSYGWSDWRFVVGSNPS